MPVYNHWQLVRDLLQCLQRKTFPAWDFEVIIVDNGSSDFAPPANVPENTRISRCPTPGSYAARNHAAEQALGEWFVFTDADCLPAPDWLQKLNEAAQSVERPTLLAGMINIVSASASPRTYEIYDMIKGIPQERYAATANLAVPHGVFKELGGLDGTRFSGGDADLCRRAGALGYPIDYVPETRGDHPLRTSWQRIATKARRVRGGQLTAGAKGRHRAWLLRTMTPPGLGAWHFLRAQKHPLRCSLITTMVLMRVWLIQLAEAFRLRAEKTARTQTGRTCSRARCSSIFHRRTAIS